MKTVQLRKIKDKEFTFLTDEISLKEPLVLVFGNRFMLQDKHIYDEIRALFNDGHIVFASTSGDITSKYVDDESVTITAIEFEKSSFIVETINVLDNNKKINSQKAGVDLIEKLPKKDLKYAFVISEGTFINVGELVKGLNQASNNDLLITGALCGDSTRFETTLSAYNELPKTGELIAIGFYGETIDVSFATKGGWIPFGPERVVTKAKGNILYEIDGEPALNLYKKYLGDKSSELPEVALSFPLKLKSADTNKSIIRSVVNIEEENNSVILGGNIKKGCLVQLMITDEDSIVNAAGFAAKLSMLKQKKDPGLAILISCTGRKFVLDQRVEEEVEKVVNVLSKNTTICGFYSYGELAPFEGEKNCQLHNQTMAITLISE